MASATAGVGLHPTRRQAARKRSPVERWQVPRRCLSSCDWVPFPTPGGPKRTRRQQLRRSRKRGLLPEEEPLNHLALSMFFRALIFSPVGRASCLYTILLPCGSLDERSSL